MKCSRTRTGAGSRDWTAHELDWAGAGPRASSRAFGHHPRIQTSRLAWMAGSSPAMTRLKVTRLKVRCALHWTARVLARIWPSSAIQTSRLAWMAGSSPAMTPLKVTPLKVRCALHWTARVLARTWPSSAIQTSRLAWMAGSSPAMMPLKVTRLKVRCARGRARSSVSRPHKSSTRRGLFEPEQHTIMVLLATRSASVRMLSRWSGVPEITAVSHAPHTPS